MATARRRLHTQPSRERGTRTSGAGGHRPGLGGRQAPTAGAAPTASTRGTAGKGSATVPRRRPTCMAGTAASPARTGGTATTSMAGGTAGGSPFGATSHRHATGTRATTGGPACGALCYFDMAWCCRPAWMQQPCVGQLLGRRAQGVDCVGRPPRQWRAAAGMFAALCCAAQHDPAAATHRQRPSRTALGRGDGPAMRGPRREFGGGRYGGGYGRPPMDDLPDYDLPPRCSSGHTGFALSVGCRTVLAALRVREAPRRPVVRTSSRPRTSSLAQLQAACPPRNVVPRSAPGRRLSAEQPLNSR